MKRGYIIALLLAVSSFFVWYNIKRRSAPKPASTDSIIIGTNAEYRPFTFIKNDQIVGFDIDIASEICNRLGKQMVLKDMAFTALIPALQKGEVQVVAAGMTPTRQRSTRVLFTKPHLKNDNLLILSLAKNPPITSLEQLSGKNVIVNEGYASDTFMSKQKGPILQRLPNPAAGFLALRSGQGDAFVIAHSSAQPFFERYDKKEFHITPIAGFANDYALAISKKHPELFEKIQKTLDQMTEDGTLDKIKAKWILK